MGIEAKEKGCFTTVAVISPGETVFINATTDRAGYIEVEAADLQGKPIQCG